MSAKLREHLPFLLVTTFLTLVMTFPTIAHVLRTDVFWLPEKSNLDVYIKLWDIWYGNLILSGQADRLHTDVIFYPEGTSLAYHSQFFLHSMVVNALHALMPISNAYSLTFMLIIFTSALGAYLYLLWLFKQKWVALFGAVVFGFSPQVIAYPAWPAIAWTALMPVTMYCVHRGINEKRGFLIVLAGLIAGSTTEVVLYLTVCVIISVGLLLTALAVSRWRSRYFWRSVLLFLAMFALSCAWRVIPMLQDQDALDRADTYAKDTDARSDLVSFFYNSKNPILGPLAKSVFEIPNPAHIASRSYLGLLPLALLLYGLIMSGSRRMALPWLGLLLAFLVLVLGSTLSVNGVVLENIKLPKHYLNRLFPSVFANFFRLELFMTGAWLPLAVLACLGLKALCERHQVLARPGFILALIAIVAFEYSSPIFRYSGRWRNDVSEERLAYLDWLGQQKESDIALVNLPFGWLNARFYSFAQTLSGYPITEGAISRPPASAYDYIRANPILGAWYSLRTIHCETTDRDVYLAALAQLEADGFSHIVLHRNLYGAAHIAESFDGVHASYGDEFVSVYGLSDLRDSCPARLSARHFFASAYSDALGKVATLDERHGATVILPPTIQLADHFFRYLRHVGQAERAVAAVYSDGQGNVEVRSNVAVDLETDNAIWLVKDRMEFKPQRSAANYAWLLERFKFCERYYQDDDTTIDLYLKVDIPCAAIDDRSALNIRYDSGVRLHHAHYEQTEDSVRFYLAWANSTDVHYAYSVQFFNADGRKALQYDQVIWRQLLQVYDVDTSSLAAGAYAVKLIVYDYETQISQGGIVGPSDERIERELDIARIDI